jgi:RHS repeat-associated protein
MRLKGMTVGLASTTAGIALGALAVAAVLMPSPRAPYRAVTAGHSYFIPVSQGSKRVLLPDGRSMAMVGDDQATWLEIGSSRQKVPLPEQRTLASVTVLPGGQVLVWGGIDVHGNVLNTGEWFDPAKQRFVHTGLLGLPARAGHQLTVLSNGHLLMTGGWSADGTPATDAIVWEPTSHQATVLHAALPVRIDGDVALLPDGSFRVQGGVDARGLPVAQVEHFDPATQRFADATTHVAAHSAPLMTVLPGVDTWAAPLQGPLNLRFSTAMDVRTLDPKTVTLIGPEGAVPVRVVATNEGRQAFVQLPDDLYPGSRYTLFVKGLKTTGGEVVPYAAVGFTTAHTVATGVVMAGQGAMPSPTLPGVYHDDQPPLYVMAGHGTHSCTLAADQLCRAHSFVREGAFYPGQNNAPDKTGAHWRVYTAHQNLPDTHSLEVGLRKGDTVLIGQVRRIDEVPVDHVAVTVGKQTVYTDAQGVFVLTGLQNNREQLFVDGGPASQGDMHYGRFLVGADVKPNAVTRMPYVMYLPRILPRDEIALPSPTTREVVLQHPDMPGLELRIPAGAVFKDKDGHVLDHIAIVPTPVDHAPFPLPDNFPMYFTIQPGDAVLQGLTPEAATGMRVVYPNYGHDQSGTPGNFWVYSAQDGWRMYGGGHVTRDGLHMSPDPGVALVWAMGAGVSLGNANKGNDIKPDNKCAADPIDAETGTFFHEWNDLAVRDIMPLKLTRAYNSADTTSHVFGVGATSNLGIHLYSSDSTFNKPQLILPCGQAIVFNHVAGNSSWPFSGDVWEHTATKSGFYGATLQFFTGTSIGEYWQITLKDGTQYGFQSDVPNQLQWMKDRYGNQVKLNYNGGLVDQVVSPSSRFINLSYDTSNRITTAADNSGRAATYSYNSAGSLAKVTYPDSTNEQYTYDTAHRMLTMQDRRGTVAVTNAYDTNGRVTSQTRVDGSAYSFGYTTDSNNKVTATLITDPDGDKENVLFDATSGYVSSDTYAYGTSLAQTTTYVREASGLIDSQTDPLGRTTTFAYDALGNVTSITRLAGTSDAVTTQMSWTADYSQLASVTDPLGHATSLTYAAGCLSQITDPLGHVATVQCTASGQPHKVTDALGNSSYLAYSGYDLVAMTDPLGRTVRFGNDALGRRVVTRDPQGNVRLISYDTNDRVVGAVDGFDQKTSMGYDANGNLLSVSLPNTGVIHYNYDNRNRLSSRTDAMNQSEGWTYDGMGNVLTHTDRKGQLTQLSYDALQRRTKVYYADGSGTQAVYDAVNRLTSLTDSSSGTLSWTYDDLNRVTATGTPQGDVSYSYDAAGRRTSMTPAAQVTANYSYDAANHLIGITQGSEAVQIGYDADNRRATLTLPNGITATYGYDAASELTALSYAKGNGTAVGNLTYAYDASGRIVSKGGTFATDLLPTPNSQASGLDLNDRTTSLDGAALSYDANGNLTSDGANTYTWNARNQLTQVSQGGVAQLSYTYDARGRRTSTAVQGATPKQFLYDGANAVQEVHDGIVNPILTGLGVDERFARNDVIGRTYFLTDQINSTVALTDAAGGIRQLYSYDPYGNVQASDTSSGFTNPYQYTGREADTPGLYYYRARYYSPMMGGFISEDPIGLGGRQSSFYAYAGSDPLSFSDPSGQDPLGAVVGGVIGGIWGYINGKVSGDCGAALRNDVLAGVATGALAGLTDGISLLDGGAGLAARAGINAAGEAGRQFANNGEVDDGLALLTAAGGSAIGDGLGSIGKELQGEMSQAAEALTDAAADAAGGLPGGFENQAAAGDAQLNQMNQDFHDFESTLH